ncbi:MAG: Maf family protein, partial [Muribaculaceae bacterium]|nr:Maf family protein [Muribaculaceae bacterium]
MVTQATDRRLVLGSNSPRRRELLAMLAADFTIAELKNIDESFPAGLPADEVPVFLSRLKADAYR